jgi:integrase
MRQAIMLTVQKKETKDGVVEYWFLRWHGQDGKYHGKSLGRCDKLSEREAKKALRIKENEFDRNPGRRNISKSMTVKEYTDLYFESRKHELAPKTLKMYKCGVRYLIEYFGEHRSIDQISRVDAGAFKAALADGKLQDAMEYKTTVDIITVNLYMRCIKAIFNRAAKDDLLLFNPFDRTVTIVKKSQSWHYVTSVEFKKMIAAASPKLGLLITLCRLAGLRSGEALSLTWHDIDWVNNRLTIQGKTDWQPKDRDSRVIPIVPELSTMLLDAHDRAETGQSIVLADVYSENVRRDVRAAVKRAGMAAYTKPLHTLRKSCLTDWAARYPMHVVAQWAGHASISTTQQYYLQVSDGDYSRAAKESFWKKPESTENGTENGKNEENQTEEQNKKAL